MSGDDRGGIAGRIGDLCDLVDVRANPSELAEDRLQGLRELRAPGTCARGLVANSLEDEHPDERRRPESPSLGGRAQRLRLVIRQAECGGAGQSARLSSSHGGIGSFSRALKHVAVAPARKDW